MRVVHLVEVRGGTDRGQGLWWGLAAVAVFVAMAGAAVLAAWFVTGAVLPAAALLLVVGLLGVVVAAESSRP